MMEAKSQVGWIDGVQKLHFLSLVKIRGRIREMSQEKLRFSL